ncbi:MAG: hypothetical protein ABGY09_06730 [Euryarchaeota archaeon]
MRTLAILAVAMLLSAVVPSLAQTVGGTAQTVQTTQSVQAAPTGTGGGGTAVQGTQAAPSGGGAGGTAASQSAQGGQKGGGQHHREKGGDHQRKAQPVKREAGGPSEGGLGQLVGEYRYYTMAAAAGLMVLAGLVGHGMLKFERETARGSSGSRPARRTGSRGRKHQAGSGGSGRPTSSLIEGHEEDVKKVKRLWEQLREE